MLQLDVIQGDESWHLARAKYRRTASLAPAIMGSSKKRSRNDAIRFLATGVDREFSQWVQDNLLDRGHLIESFAKPLAEKIIGKKLYPITAISDDEYMLASYDGISADDEDAWECKSWNEKKAEDVRAGKIPDEDVWQVVQQLAIGAKRCLYMVTDGTEEKTVYCWMVRDEINSLIGDLIAGWNQADNDVANYVHVEHTEKPEAEVCIELPALFIHAQGQITDSNMQAYGEALTAKLSEVRAIQLVTDQDFSNAKEAAKLFREQCKKLELAKEAMLSQTVTIGEAARMMDAWHEDLRQTALKLEKDVEREDLAKKRAMVSDAGIKFSAHVEALEAETRPIQLNVPRPNFADAIKGKRNYASMQDAVDTALAQSKIDADTIGKDIRTKQAWFFKNDNDPSNTSWIFLFSDLQQIITKPMDDFKLLVTTRIDKHKADEAAKIERIRAEEQVKAEAAAKAKVEAEAKAKVDNETRAAEVFEAARVQSQPDEAAAIEARRKQAQIAEQSKPFNGVPARPTLPNDKAIIEAVQAAFGVSYGIACDWIIDVAENLRVAA